MIHKFIDLNAELIHFFNMSIGKSIKNENVELDT